MKENAILIRFLDVVKVHVNFDDERGIYDALGVDRVSTIHTAKTQDISNKLGVHIIGYVNREGNDINNDLACQISGYDYLGSFMLVCKTDNKFNLYPFEENELESVYTYLTTGKVVPVYMKLDEAAFFEKHNINPVLPNLNVSHEAQFFTRFPSVICLSYKENELVKDEDFQKFGEALFLYSDRIIKEMDSYGANIYIDKKGGVGLDDCEAVSRSVEPVLDSEDFIDEAYTFEVSPPGLDRPLKTDRDFERYEGEDVEVRLYAALDGKKKFVGKLAGKKEGVVTIETDAGTMDFQEKDVACVKRTIVW